MSVQWRDTKAGRRWDVRLRDPSGRVYNRTFRTRQEAISFERAELSTRDQGQWVDPRAGRQTVAEWVEHWFPVHEHGLAPSTRSQYRSTINRRILPALGHRRLESITPLDIQRLVNDWTDDAKPSTVHHRFAVLRTLFKAAVDAEQIGRTPCRGIRRPRIEHHPRQLPTVAQVTELAATTRSEYRPMVWIGAMLGLRWGEVAGLRIGAIDLDRRQLIVIETVGEASGKIHTGVPKSTAGNRAIPIPQPLADLLAEHIKAMGLPGNNRSRYLFPAPHGGPLRYSWWHEKVWDPARRTTGLPGLGFHDLRRFYATLLVETRADVKISQELMGHQDSRMTRGLYAQAGTEAKRRANDAIAAELQLPDTDLGPDIA